MAGSMKDMIYTTDRGDPFYVRIDESNGEAGGFIDVTANGTPAYSLPRYTKMRYLNISRTNLAGEKLSRRLYVGDLTIYSGLIDDGSVTVDGVSWSITNKSGEKSRVAQAADTGQTDLDAT